MPYPAPSITENTPGGSDHPHFPPRTERTTSSRGAATPLTFQDGDDDQQPLAGSGDHLPALPGGCRAGGREAQPLTERRTDGRTDGRGTAPGPAGPYRHSPPFYRLGAFKRQPPPAASLPPSNRGPACRTARRFRREERRPRPRPAAPAPPPPPSRGSPPVRRHQLPPVRAAGPRSSPRGYVWLHCVIRLFSGVEVGRFRRGRGCCQAAAGRRAGRRFCHRQRALCAVSAPGKSSRRPHKQECNYGIAVSTSTLHCQSTNNQLL